MEGHSAATGKRVPTQGGLKSSGIRVMQDELPPYLGTSIIDPCFLRDLSSLWTGPLSPNALHRIEQSIRAFLTAHKLAHIPYPATLGVAGYHPNYDDKIKLLMSETKDVDEIGALYYRSNIAGDLCEKLGKHILSTVPATLYDRNVPLPEWLDADFFSHDCATILSEDKSSYELYQFFLLRQLNYARFVIEASRMGASVLSRGPGYDAAIAHIYQEWPDEIFHDLDKEYQDFLRKVRGPGTGLDLPPLIALIFSIARNRDDIPSTLVQMRQEYSGAREELWSMAAVLIHIIEDSPWIEE